MTTAPLPTAAPVRSPSSFAPPADDVDTIADLLARLAVPARRVWSIPMPGTADEDDLLYATETLGRRCELIDGTIVEKPVGNSESAVAAYLSFLIVGLVTPRKLGIVLGEASLFRCLPRQVRGPDVAFVATSQMPDGMPADPVWGFGPALVVEVLSPSNTRREMRRKRQLFFGAGTQLFWMIDPRPRTIHAYTAPEQFTVLTAADRLAGGAVLPGFDVAVADVFSPLDA